ASLPSTGGVVILPAGNYKCNSPINIGNGSSTQNSTRQGIVLMGIAPSVIAGSGTPNANGVSWQGTTRLFAGASLPSIVSVNGPLQGWGLQNLHLDGNGNATIGLVEYSAQSGFCSNLFISNCTYGQICTTVDFPTTSPPPGSPNHQDNYYRQILITIPSI